MSARRTPPLDAGCVLNVKGKLNALIFIAPARTTSARREPELRETLAQRFDRYVIADDVTIEDVTGSRAFSYHR